MSAFPRSSIETAIAGALPTLFEVLGIPAVHSDGTTETPTRIITTTGTDPLGEFSERVAPRFEIECPAELAPRIGDTWTLDDGSTWRADALLDHDGLVVRFLVVDITADPAPDPDPDPETEPDPEPTP